MHSRRRTRRIIAIIILLLVIALLAVLYINYRATHQLGFEIRPQATEEQVPPDFLFSFSGPADDSMVRPVGVFVRGNVVYVVDSRRAVVDVFNLDGERQASFGSDVLKTPLYIAYNPTNDTLYVTDRRTRSVQMFSPDGKSLGEFDPKLPKDQLPKFETGGVQWAPIGIAIADDGTMYVTEILNGHRLLVFDPTGKFVKSVGDAGFSVSAESDPELFQFPNSIQIHGDEVWVADSNNRRIQVFSKEGEYLRLVPVSGLPRGFAFLERFRSQDASSPTRFAVVDTLAHDVTIWNVEGTQLVTFGGSGVLDGQFAYPGDISVATGNRLYISDTNNSRVQVWAWIDEIQPIPTPKTAAQWAWCLSPLLLLPLLLLFRRRRFMATVDFVEAVAATEELEQLPKRDRRWIVHENDMPAIEAMTVEPNSTPVLDIVAFEGYPSSDSDARDLETRLEIDADTAERLALAKRAKVLCTEDPEFRRLARLLEIDVVNREEFMERFGTKDGEDGKDDSNGPVLP